MKNYLQIVKDQRHPLRFLLSRILMVGGVSKLLTIQRNGYRVRFYPTPHIAELWIDLSYRRDEEAFVRQYLKEGDTVVDVGANIGLITLFSASIVGETGRVFSVEANPRVFRFLRGNVQTNGFENVVCIHAALGEKEGTVHISNMRWDEMNAIVAGPGQTGTIEVPVRRLDGLGITVPKISLLKIDVEGYEFFVLQGAGKVLDITECVFFESNQDHYAKYGYTSKDLYMLLQSHGFHLFKIVGGSLIRPVTSAYVSPENENLVAVRDVEGFIRRTGYTRQ